MAFVKVKGQGLKWMPKETLEAAQKMQKDKEEAAKRLKHGKDCSQNKDNE